MGKLDTLIDTYQRIADYEEVDPRDYDIALSIVVDMMDVMRQFAEDHNFRSNHSEVEEELKYADALSLTVELFECIDKYIDGIE